MRPQLLKYALISATSFIALAAAPGLATAQVATAPDEAGASAANAAPLIIVTANRAPTPADQVGQSVTVLTGA